MGVRWNILFRGNGNGVIKNYEISFLKFILVVLFIYVEWYFSCFLDIYILRKYLIMGWYLIVCCNCWYL